jgi:hypothetical protein
MTTIFVDFNDLARPGCVVLRARMQPNGELPSLQAGSHVLLTEYGSGETYAAVVLRDPKTGAWLANLDAMAKNSETPGGVAAAGK